LGTVCAKAGKAKSAKTPTRVFRSIADLEGYRANLKIA
jgi:hypothetical protein